MSKQKYKILIIDDNAEDRVTFRYFLQKDDEFEYKFLEAELGEAGIEICLAEQPDCVLLDYNLPDINGLAVLKAINPDPLNPVFPVILLTGEGDESLVVKAMKQGAQDYLVKGELSYRELYRAVHSAMEIVSLRRKHKISENERRESQEHLSAIFRQTAVGICQTDMRGRYVMVNDKFCELVGRTREELLTRRFQDITHPEDLQPNLEMIGKMRKGAPSFVIEKRYIRPDDSIVWVSSSVSFIYDTNGELQFGVAAMQDITESKMAEIDLRRSEAELKDFIENASVGLHWVDGDGNIIWANRAEMELLGYSPEEYIGHSISEFHADEEVIGDILRRLKSDDTLHNYEARLRCKDGSLRHVLINSNVLWQDGKFVHTRCFTRDISERKQAEEALNRYRLLSERSRDIMLFFRTDGQFVEVNQAAVNTYGYTREELLAKSFYDIRAEATRKDIPAQLRQAEKGAFQFETVHRRKDGTEFPVEVSWSFTELAGEHVILSIVRDITERKQAEEELRTSEEFNRTVLESSPDCVKILNDEGRLQYMNVNGLCLLEIDDFAPCHNEFWWNLWQEESQPLVKDAVKKALRGESVKFEAYRPTVKGTSKWWDIIVSPIPGADGKPPQLISVSRDITERKYRELNLAFLANVQKDFAPLSSAEAIMNAVSERLAEYLNVSRCSFIEINETADIAKVVSDYHTPDLSSLIGDYKLSEFHTEEERRTLAAETPLVINDVRDKSRTAEAAANFEALGIRALANVPYSSHGQWKFSIAVQNNQPRQWRTDEIELLGELAERIYIRLERARAEEKLRESEERFRRVLKQSPAGFVQTDAAGKMILVNERWCEMFGYGEAEMLQMNIIDITHPTSVEATLEAVGRLAKGGADFQIEKNYRRKNGLVMRANSNVAGLRDADDKFQGLIAVVLDITERTESEEKIRASEERFRTIFESIDEGFCIIEMIFDKHNKPSDYRFEQINPAFSRLTGLPESAVGKTILELVPDLENFWVETYGKVVLTGEPARFENEAVSMNRWFDVFASRIGNSNSRRVAVVFNNITDRKEIEARREQLLQEEQRAREAAEAANVAKDEFLAVLSHELRSPLNSMLGWATMLNNGSLNKEMQKQAVGVIERNIRLQNSLIEDLLDVSRIISGKMRLEPENLSFISVVQNAVEAARPAGDAKNIKLDAAFDCAADEMHGDANRLQQLVGNLLTNAIKFTPENGAVNIFLECRSDTAKLTIKDNGIGISAELLPRIFERFRQADGSSRRQFGGLGLGLTIVKHLAEMHGGRVFAESDGENKGATFTVELPLIKSYTTTDTSATKIENEENYHELQMKLLENIKLLVVDDDADALDLLRFVLELKGAAVTCVSSADQALHKLQNNKFDLLISDLGMAGTDGFDLIRRLRTSENEEIAALPAIALTGYVSAEDRERVLSAGFQIHLPKPLDIENLPAIVLNLISNP